MSTAVASAPSTPAPPQLIRKPESTPQPGTWRHPKLDEIIRRQNASRFGEDNARTVIWHTGFLVVSFLLPELERRVRGYVSVHNFLKSISPYPYYALILLRIILLLNVAYAMYPLLRPKDDLSDIPLTPSQRSLLGLEPISTPITPGSQYITPPRYARSSTPRSGSRPASRSPLSGRESPLGRTFSGSPFSPSTTSPLLQKAMGGSTTRRLSFGSQAQLGSNIVNSSVIGAPGTSMPSTGRASVGLNNRWLYERGRLSPGSRSVYS
ncbi:putative nuclear pore complex component [Cryomyces antarcticus]